MPFNIGPGELLLILAIALLVIGPGRLPDVGAALGKSLREFRKATQEVQEAVSVQPRPNELRQPAQPTVPAPASPPAAEAAAEESAAASDEPTAQA
jgi:TatA/E family protein of Tat protein translocase